MDHHCEYVFDDQNQLIAETYRNDFGLGPLVHYDENGLRMELVAPPDGKPTDTSTGAATPSNSPPDGPGMET